MVAALLGGKPPQTPPHGSRTPTGGLRETKFPLEIPSPQAGNGIGKSDGETPKKRTAHIQAVEKTHSFLSVKPKI